MMNNIKTIKENKAKLNIIVSRACPFAGVNFEDSNDLIKKAEKEGHTIITIFYLHGILEEAMGYDIGACLNGEKCIEGNLFKEGIYNVKVEGYNNPCKAYLWNSCGRPNGLIVDATSKEDCEFANKKYTEKSEDL